MRLASALLYIAICSAAIAQPGPRPNVSIETRSLMSDTVFIGTIVSFGNEEPFTGGVRPVVFEVVKPLKGKLAGPLSIRTKTTETDLRIWKTRKSSLAVFAMKGLAYYELVDLGSKDLLYSRDDFSLVQNGADFVRTAAKACREGTSSQFSTYLIVRPPDGEVGKRWIEAFLKRPKADATHTQRPWDNVYEGLAISLSRSQEALARRKAKSASLNTVREGLAVLARCQNAENLKIFRSLMKSPIYSISKSAEQNQGVEIRHYDFREAAWLALRTWSVNETQPVLDESVNVIGTVKRLQWKGPLTAEAMASLAKNRQIQALTLADASIDQPLIDKISRLGSLRELGLVSCTGLDAAAFDGAMRLQNLRKLNLSGSAATDQTIPYLIRLRKLEELNLDHTDITTSGFKAIIKARPDLRVIPEHPFSVLFTYLEQLDIDMVRRALRADPNAINDRGILGGMPLHRVCGWGNEELIKLFLDSGADIEADDGEGKTPLLWLASRFGCEPGLVRLLIDRGADLSKKDKNGMNALLLAMNTANRQLVPLLIACGVDATARDSRGRNALGMVFGAYEAERKLIQDRINDLANPVKFVPLLNIPCNKTVYETKPNLIDNWSSKPSSSLSGPLGWQTTPSGRSYLGPFNQQAVSLHLDRLPAHKHLKVEIELFVIGSWDGNGCFGAGPDIIDISLPGRGALLHSSFFNNGDDHAENTPIQSYPNPYALGFHKGFTGASETQSLGFQEVWTGKTYRRDAVYRLTFSFEHDLSSLDVEFSGLTTPQFAGMNLLDEERWGIGSVRVLTD